MNSTPKKDLGVCQRVRVLSHALDEKACTFKNENLFYNMMHVCVKFVMYFKGSKDIARGVNELHPSWHLKSPVVGIGLRYQQNKKS